MPSTASAATLPGGPEGAGVASGEAVGGTGIEEAAAPVDGVGVVVGTAVGVAMLAGVALATGGVDGEGAGGVTNGAMVVVGEGSGGFVGAAEVAVSPDGAADGSAAG